MNFGQDHDGKQHEPLTLSPAEKADGFAAVMRRLKDHSPHEQARLRAQADAAVLGHEAYALGHEYHRRGNYVAAKRWLRVAADHSVPGAEEALEEIDAGQPASPAAGRATAVGFSGPAPSATIPSPPPAGGGFEKWAAVLDCLDVTASAREQARQITEEARSAAEDLLAEARQKALREQLDSKRGLERTRRAVARLLCEAQQVQQETKQIQEQARWAAETLLDEARRQAQQIVDEALVQATRTGVEARREVVDGSNRARGGVRMLNTSLDEAGVDGRQAWLYAARELFTVFADHLPERCFPADMDEIRRPLWVSRVRTEFSGVLWVRCSSEDATVTVAEDWHPQQESTSAARFVVGPLLVSPAAEKGAQLASFKSVTRCDAAWGDELFLAAYAAAGVQEDGGVRTVYRLALDCAEEGADSSTSDTADSEEAARAAGR
ncbi:hypothetical protein [Streptomyces sp. NPDC018693]|uniref:hypothetical protein n=1 Tax=unclassified Streptomyces TaxID=2593676 RepID=UPI00378A2E57